MYDLYVFVEYAHIHQHIHVCIYRFRVCVCVCVCMTWWCIHFTCTHLCVKENWVFRCTFKFVCIFVCLYVCTYVYACLHVQIITCMYRPPKKWYVVPSLSYSVFSVLNFWWLLVLLGHDAGGTGKAPPSPSSSTVSSSSTTTSYPTDTSIFDLIPMLRTLWPRHYHKEIQKEKTPDKTYVTRSVYGSVNLLVVVCSLASHRHSYIPLIFSSRFIDS